MINAHNLNQPSYRNRGGCAANGLCIEFFKLATKIVIGYSRLNEIGLSIGCVNMCVRVRYDANGI